MENLYNILNIKKDSKKSDIKKAFRKKVKNLHPDSNKTKDTNEFMIVKEAYEILMDDDKRKMYDEFGFIHSNKADDQIRQHLVIIFKEIITRYISDLEHIDMFAKMNEYIDKKDIEFNTNKTKLEETKKKMENISERISSIEEENIFTSMIKSELGMIDQKIKEIDDNITISNIMREKLKKYKYKYEERKNEWNVFDNRRTVFGLGGMFDQNVTATGF